MSFIHIFPCFTSPIQLCEFICVFFLPCLFFFFFNNYVYYTQSHPLDFLLLIRSFSDKCSFVRIDLFGNDLWRYSRYISNSANCREFLYQVKHYTTKKNKKSLRKIRKNEQIKNKKLTMHKMAPPLSLKCCAKRATSVSTTSTAAAASAAANRS